MTRMRLIRQAIGRTLHDISKRTGIQQSRLSLIERGLEEARPYELERLANVLGFPRSEDLRTLASPISVKEFLAMVSPFNEN